MPPLTSSIHVPTYPASPRTHCSISVYRDPACTHPLIEAQILLHPKTVGLSLPFISQASRSSRTRHSRQTRTTRPRHVPTCPMREGKGAFCLSLESDGHCETGTN
ncbi:hypothetical protein BaRGS_00012043 [Batillaria attramentaria]|uniref:Uncharacterized protein n=1 Tax=Batillaria attramentaria TaxID=370345 RepID=A0ABD0LC06_9CAEN